MFAVLCIGKHNIYDLTQIQWLRLHKLREPITNHQLALPMDLKTSAARVTLNWNEFLDIIKQHFSYPWRIIDKLKRQLLVTELLNLTYAHSYGHPALIWGCDGSLYPGFTVTASFSVNLGKRVLTKPPWNWSNLWRLSESFKNTHFERCCAKVAHDVRKLISG